MTAHAVALHPGGGRLDQQVHLVNLSASGASLILRTYVHAGSTVRLGLRTRDGEPVDARGRAVWCTYLKDQFHALGVELDEPIPVREIVPRAALTSVEDAEPAKSTPIQGQILIVSESPLDRSVLSMHLAGTEAELAAASSAGDAIDRLRDTPVDILLVDLDMEDDSPIDVLQRLRLARFDGPMLLLSNDPSASAVATTDPNGNARFLTKPVDADTLHQALRTVLADMDLTLTASTPIFCDLGNAADRRQFVQQYIDNAIDAAQQALIAAQRDEPERARAMVSRLAGTGSASGFEPVTVMAQLALETIDASDTIADCLATLKRLLNICHRLEIAGGDKPDIDATAA
jgi:DNA-binding NarL/FixJ family response regulator